MRRYLMLVLSSLLAWTAALSFGQSPIPLESLGPIADLEVEVESQIEILEELLESEESFEDGADDVVRQAFGVLACMGQAIAEHSGNSETKINGPALRDAALMLKRNSDYEEAQEALEAVKDAHSGQASGEHEVEYAWDKLFKMYPMMEEMNARNSKILRILRRPRGNADEPVHATTWAVLSIAMEADTHDVKNDDDLPQWHKMSDEFRTASVKLAEAIRQKDAKEARIWFDKANETCDACHEVFE